MKKLLIFIGVVFHALANAQQLTPFDQWERDTPKWTEDLTEVVYVAGRCASISHTLGMYISQEGNKPEDVAMGKKFIDAGNTFTTVSLEIGKNLGMSNQFIYDRHEALTKVYVQKLVENKKMHNQIFVGDFAIDFKFCVAQHSFFKSLSDYFDVAKKK
jgi:hypothetical protein